MSVATLDALTLALTDGGHEIGHREMGRDHTAPKGLHLT